MQNTHINDHIRELHRSLLTIVGVMNQPHRDEVLLQEAGVKLDRALFPLLILTERLGPIGVVELADRVGRDYTTVSRQIARLESLGLITRQGNPRDRRIRESTVTPAGKAMTDKIDVARERFIGAIFAHWDEQEVVDFVRLIGKYAQAIKA